MSRERETVHIESVYNGFILDYPNPNDENRIIEVVEIKVPDFADDSAYEAAEIGALKELLYKLVSLYDTTSRRSPHRIHIELRPGDKYEDETTSDE